MTARFPHGILHIALAAVIAGMACTRRSGEETRNAGAGSSGAASAAKPSILLISMDTTRADRLGCYGSRAGATPNLDRWAGEGVLFENALTPVPVTLPAHTSLMTGLLPQRHGVRNNGTYRAPSDVPILAALLAGAGYDTAAVVGSAILDRQYGLDRGFRRYDDGVGSGGLAIAERSAAQVTDAAVAQARGLGAPFFLFVHYFDPHAAYNPPEPFAARFRSDPYEGEIAYVDEQIGRLRRELEALGRLEHTIVIVTADHGESLGEHGEPTHGVFLYQATVHVPLLIVAPGRWQGGGRVKALASLIDVVPTVLELAAQTAPKGLDGRSLVSAAMGKAAEARWLPLESEFGYDSYGWAPLAGLTDGALKWIDAPEQELYDLGTDPAEQRNLAGSRPADRDRLAHLRRELVTENRRSAAQPAGTEQAESERLARLAALGYTGLASGPPADVRGLPDPKRVVGGLAAINDARQLMGAGKLQEAETTLERVVEQSPRNLSALVLLGSVRIMGGRAAKAVAPLERASALAPLNADVQFNLGLARLGRGDAEGAEKAWRRTLELAPRYRDAAVNLIDLLGKTNRLREAESALADSRRNGLEGPLLDYLEGKLAAARGDGAGARAALTRALAGSLPAPAAADAKALLASLNP